MSKLRNYFKLQAQANEDRFKTVLEESFEDLWQIATICENRVKNCFESSFNGNEKKYIMIIMLRNSISDLLCTIDSLERGHGQTILNNLRMVFEHLCLTFDMNTNETVFEAFKLSKHDVPSSVSKAKKNYQGFGKLYGELSNVSHQSKFEYVLRQARKTEQGVVFFHLKSIDPNDFKIQINALLVMILLFRAIAELSEEICINLIDRPYFWKKDDKGYQQNFDTDVDVLMQKFCTRAEIFLPELKANKHQK